MSSSCVRFIPSQLSKTDRPSHMGPPIVISRLPVSNDDSICPVAALEKLLVKREQLNIAHDFIFTVYLSSKNL